jgi:hypothetical protein
MYHTYIIVRESSPIIGTVTEWWSWLSKAGVQRPHTTRPDWNRARSCRWTTVDQPVDAETGAVAGGTGRVISLTSTEWPIDYRPCNEQTRRDTTRRVFGGIRRYMPYLTDYLLVFWSCIYPTPKDRSDHIGVGYLLVLKFKILSAFQQSTYTCVHTHLNVQQFITAVTMDTTWLSVECSTR